ncbi:MAG: hypothetical protein B9S33_02465 [Pedosphaera sp. Tous-C6FEB]|nr:MAG: hypothetical protein B9S33_02465 [Pedosphaera sp. Tous-C6FEB]
MLKTLGWIALAAFWVTMNVLLWRSEFRGEGEGTPVPLPVVWEKVLRAPDDSHLEVFHQKRKIGHLRWSATAGEQATTNAPGANSTTEEGMVQRIGGYAIDILDGRFDLGADRRRIRFTMHSSFTTNHQWQSFNLQLNQRPMNLELAAASTNQTVAIRFQDGDQSIHRTFTFAQLRDPAKLLQEVVGPVPLGLLTGGLLGGAATPGAPAELAALPALQRFTLGLQWDSRLDWIKIGQAKLRCYRLHARWLDKHQVTIYVSRVGEILRVQLPNEVVLQNTRMLLL